MANRNKYEIKSKYDLPVEVDGVTYPIIVCNANKEQKDELDAVVDKNRGLFAKQDEIQADLTESEEEFAVNKHILAHGKITDIVSVMFEQKTLNKKIFKLRKELEETKKDLISVGEAIENIFKVRYKLLVYGESKATLAKELDKKSIPYRTLFDSIEKLIENEHEKK